jgi:4-alpha-glucanotransferase
MNNCIRLCLVLHNHQPIGNFDDVFEHAYRDSYRPFLDVFEGYEHLQISLHTSGPLIEWLNDHHPEYLDRLARLVEAGRVEIVGGAFYEPILTMIPSRDRVGQITSFTDWLESRLGGKVRGAWVPERVWEQSLTGDLAEAGMQYTVLDDFHFRGAGLTSDQLHGYYVTEDDGQILSIFPGSERLRYLIPFRNPEETIEYLREIADQHPNSVMVFGDDGEKFGTWPETNKHCYQDGWLRRFFDALSANRHWLKTTTLAEASTRPADRQDLSARCQLSGDDRVGVAGQPATGLRQSGPRSAGRSALAADQAVRARRILAELPGQVPGGERDVQPHDDGQPPGGRSRTSGHRRRGLVLGAARAVSGQCNCSYWHGAFGGIYLPHLRNAVYNHLIAADNLLDRVFRPRRFQVSIEDEDFDFDGRREVQLANDRSAGPAGAGLRRASVRTGRPLDLPQSAGDA